MSNDYHQLKKDKGKTARLGVWIIILLIIVFGLILLRFATSGSGTHAFRGMPSKQDAYEVAKIIVKPSLKGTDAKFNEEGFEFGKRSDSVYVIRSYADVTTNDGSQGRQYFNVTIKYNGGIASKPNNWELQGLHLQ